MVKSVQKRFFAMALSFVLLLSMVGDVFHAVDIVDEDESSAYSWQDVFAGIADPRSMFDPIDESDVPDAVGYDVAVSRGHVQRLYSEEGNSLNTVVFLNADGTKTLYSFDFPVKYVEADGDIADISLEIADTVASAAPYQSATGDAITRFSANLDDGISLSKESTEIKLTPILPIPDDGTLSMTAQATAAQVSRVNRKKVSYYYDEHTTIEYSLTYTGFKEDIVVSQYTGQSEYAFTLETNGLTLVNEGTSFYLVDEEGVRKATLGDIIIFSADEKNNTMGYMTAVPVVRNQKYLLTIHVDPEYLQDPETAYPIRIDPTIEIDSDSGSGAIHDVTINELSGSSGSSGSLYVGYRETYGRTRILMRFPGLNLSQIPSASHITSATVQMRDLMCQSAAMTLECYPFTGNEWVESTANWSNVSPNSYGTLLSSNVISQANGLTQDVSHWYSFDITAAVQGWKSGNYNQNKGILFKAPSSVEGVTYISKTFGSFNRSSYKPTLTVTYVEGSASEFVDGVYYANNKQYGDYLRFYNASLSPQSGLLSDLGTSIQWTIVGLSDQTYAIRAVNDPTKYLGVSGDYTSVSLVTVGETAVPSNCRWLISVASGGGCLLRSTYNAGYLSTNGTALYTVDSVGASGSLLYNSCVWRLAQTSYYGSNSSYGVMELSSSTTFMPLNLSVGYVSTAQISKGNSKEIWCEPSDFVYTYSGTIVNIDSFSGRFTATKAGSASVSLEHKVTNRVLTLQVNVSGLLIYQTRRSYYLDADGFAAEDLMCGDKSLEQLESVENLELDLIQSDTEQSLIDLVEDMATETTIFDLEMRTVALDMVSHFVSGSGTAYSNSVLTQKVYNHSSTQAYVSSISSILQNLINTYCDDITAIEHSTSLSAEERAHLPVVAAMKDHLIAKKEPVYSTWTDYGNGIAFCLHSLWGNKFEITEFVMTGDTYRCVIHYTLYDHFGLNADDLQQRYEIYLDSISAWYLLQHYDAYDQAYKPFLTLIEFDDVITGTIG